MSGPEFSHLLGEILTNYEHWQDIEQTLGYTVTRGLGEGCGYQPVSGARHCPVGLLHLGRSLAASCVTWQAAPGPASGSLARHESGSESEHPSDGVRCARHESRPESVSNPAMACGVLERCGKQGSDSKVSVEQVQATFGKFPRTNTLSVREVQLFFFFFLAIFGRVYCFFGYPPAEIVGSCLGAKLYEMIMIF